jgi:flagellar hook-associated protein 3 FlgL
MRISTNTIYDSGIATMQQQTERLLRTQQQIASGRRILTPADDPVAAARVLEVSQAQSINTQYGTNSGTAGDSLGLEESTLGGVTGLLQNVRDITNNAGNPILSQNDRASLANNLRGRYQELLGLANSTDGSGQYLFSGYQGGIRPFSESAPGVVTYNGDQGQRLIQISPSRQIAVSDAGADVFQRILAGNGSFVTQAGGGNTGQGVIDSGVVVNPVTWNAAANGKDFSIKFAGTATVTAAATNTAGGASGTAGIVNQTLWNAGSKSYSIAFTSAATYDIVDNTTNTVVVAGAAYTSGATINFQGMNAVITDGAGPVTPQAGDTFTISPDFPSGLTYDIVDNVSGNSLLTGLTAGPPPYARSFGTVGSIGFKSQGGEPAFDFGIATTINGTPNAGDTFSIKASTNQDVFRTINDLADLLQTSSSGAALTNGLVTAQRNLDNAMENISTVRASTGARMKELDSVKSAGDDRALQYSQTLSRLQDVDYAKAASELIQQQVNLEAAQKSFAKVAELSLFNYL